jgi:hypothetical protein
MDKNEHYTIFDAYVHLDKIAERNPNAYFPAHAVASYLRLITKGAPPQLAETQVLKPFLVNLHASNLASIA